MVLRSFPSRGPRFFVSYPPVSRPWCSLLGVIVVWLFQGMPLLGALLSCLGILSTCVGVIGLGNNLVWHRHKADDSRKAHQEVAVAGETLTKKEGIDDVEE